MILLTVLFQAGRSHTTGEDSTLSEADPGAHSRPAPPSPNTQPAAQQGGGASTHTVQREGTGAVGAAAAAEAAAFATNKKRLMVHKSPGVKATGKGSKTYTQT